MTSGAQQLAGALADLISSDALDKESYKQSLRTFILKSSNKRANFQWWYWRTKAVDGVNQVIDLLFSLSNVPLHRFALHDVTLAGVCKRRKQNDTYFAIEQSGYGVLQQQQVDGEDLQQEYDLVSRTAQELVTKVDDTELSELAWKPDVRLWVPIRFWAKQVPELGPLPLSHTNGVNISGSLCVFVHANSRADHRLAQLAQNYPSDSIEAAIKVASICGGAPVWYERSHAAILPLEYWHACDSSAPRTLLGAMQTYVRHLYPKHLKLLQANNDSIEAIDANLRAAGVSRPRFWCEEAECASLEDAWEEAVVEEFDLPQMLSTPSLLNVQNSTVAMHRISAIMGQFLPRSACGV